jgi:hypothetical protein
MIDEAAQVLGVSQWADAQTIESAYWRLAKEIALQRRADDQAGERLDKLNWAYHTLSRYVQDRQRPPDKPSAFQRVRRFALAATVACLVTAGALAGLAYRGEIQEWTGKGVDRAERRWDDTITWLQDIGPQATPTPQPPAPPAAP